MAGGRAPLPLRFQRVLERRLDRPSKKWLLSEELEWRLSNALMSDMLAELEK